ncbi:4-(cytidine 5'-diphospho)-2-C-methyl-D-erythritol kinase [Ligilactobacillus ceti]|uniref:4-diphosphocytidyl-2-C-methyl-D-erythritol kinase n=1 Tax=Ligilactobacillus ceti DSM 22408 TaxID=1122146 RepID=A0A0R2KJK8_9LACO|nr:4-(cytidine 5'-diphospho)-2-C-methyl-D-erythritol kinase [Ligilactobacillus ceti]KRN89403.1 4-diphosphocytidyl-2-C-methyl-D-erythritol kinase [Ligilactobacillus ceti DSM 22408]
MEITEKAPAKLNLCLDTPFRHSDGSPEWSMVMTAVDLADYVQITTHTDSLAICVETNSGFLPCDQRNLAYQAAKLLQRKYKIQEGVSIKIQKNIPVAAGMGGGSADAAAVLRGLNKIWELGLSKAELAKLALSIDSDVPFCVYSTPAHVTGKGEIITPLPKLPQMWIVIAKMKTSVSTPKILRSIDYDTLPHQNVDAVVQAIKNNDPQNLCQHMGNSLEAVTSQRHPNILVLKEKMLKFGADAAVMSGSGPTVFGICKKHSRAQHLYNSLKGFCQNVYLVRPIDLQQSEEH